MTTDISLISTRTIDGSGNNAADPGLGAVHAELVRLSDPAYADGVVAPSGPDRPNPRAISNAVAEQDGALPSTAGVSDFLWAWGQFIDHDLSLTEPEPGSTEVLPIVVPAGDPDFDPFGTGTVEIAFTRSAHVEGTGTDAANPREHENEITSFIDASMVYGSDAETAQSLRGEGGTLLVDANGLLPELEGGNLLAGDIRAGENIALASLHTLFVREHNFWVGELAAANPDATDDALYAAARLRVEAIVQAITYNEFLSTLLGADAVDAYDGYDPTVDPTIATEFSTAAFRFGHTLLSPTLGRIEEDGEDIAAGSVALRDAFFLPSIIGENGGIAPILRGLADGSSQELDAMIVEDVRSFLFGPPGAGGLDLASLNIQRGRDHGITDYNSLREAVGLERVTAFSDITADAATAAALESVYGSIDLIDPWVGGLAEDATGDSLLGPLFTTIIADQFERTRDGDSLWSEAVLPEDVAAELWTTTLADVIERNTDVEIIQDNVFLALDRVSVPGADGAVVGGADAELLLGAAGAETLLGGAGDDQLDGGAGDDRLEPGTGDDTIEGGSGLDAAVFEAGFQPQAGVIGGHDGLPVGNGSETDAVSGVELVVAGQDVFLVTAAAPVAAAAAGVTARIDEGFYLDANPDVAAAVAAGTVASAAAHYADFGQGEGRDPNALFDTDYYLATNPDVAAAIQAGAFESAFQHFAQHGVIEGRDPSAFFDTSAYLARYGDVAAAGVDALDHFLTFGLAEGRSGLLTADGMAMIG